VKTTSAFWAPRTTLFGNSRGPMRRFPGKSSIDEWQWWNMMKPLIFINKNTIYNHYNLQIGNSKMSKSPTNGGFKWF
jgi:hypothetical protein